MRACEGVAAAAGFTDIYIQAATILRDGGSPLGGWLSSEYKVQTRLAVNNPFCVSGLPSSYPCTGDA